MLTTNRVHSLIAGIAMLVLLMSFSANAQSQGKSVKIPYGMTINFCNFEEIETTGNINLVFTLETDANGCTKVKYHANTQNVKGVGLDTGNEYRIISVGNEQDFDATTCDGCEVEIHFTSIWKVMTKDGQSFNNRINMTLVLNFCTFEISVLHGNGDSGCN